ncbi:MAG TPA: membrane protein insertion efficiency factor YidD [Candidatus Acetothermia bacterium]|nr:membrane protein insertion efficiency factor YidD [Candidatus Bipolaricaulota bacterium]RLE40178.1 MAG: membrane protein insertion efficiency factor YidD [Candidatus Acetothermia bacterium]HDJ29950.1 membrane protein insertion efficiency factor YidD [Candidatus Acetothermia bacterium]
MLKRILVGMITIYQRVISPAFPSRCRFYPTCSQYSKEAILKYGPGKGTYLAVRRIMRCHPRNPGGYDPVP